MSRTEILKLRALLEEKELLIQKQQKDLQEKDGIIQEQHEDLQEKENIIQEQNEDLQEKEGIIQEQQKYVEQIIPIKDLYKQGLPLMPFIKICTKESSHKSDHIVKNLKEYPNQEFKILKNLKQFLNQDALNYTSSIFLTELRDENFIVEYADESTIHNLVKNYLSDLIKGTKLFNKISVKNGLSVGIGLEDIEETNTNFDFDENVNTNIDEFIEDINFINEADPEYDEILQRELLNPQSELSRFINLDKKNSTRKSNVPKDKQEKTKLKRITNRPDLFIIVNDQKRPIGILEIKSPDKFGYILNDVNVLSQLFDYMLSLKSFYFNGVVYGIITTLKHWKICWLSDTNSSAINDRILKFFPGKRVILKNREFCSSPIYPHNHKNLAKYIISVILKSYYSEVDPINLFDTNRTYIKLNQENWIWKRYNTEQIEKWYENVNFKLPHVEDDHSKEFSILRYFHTNEETKVRLVVSNGGNIVVIKQFEDDNLVKEEYKCWIKINQVKDVNIVTLNNRECLMMPFAFNASYEYNDELQSWVSYFNFNLDYWCFQDKNINSEIPNKLKQFELQLKELNTQNHYKVDEVAKIAIANAAFNKYIHDDLEFRHIALLPIFDNKDNLIDLRPILIDFGIMSKVQTMKEAEIKMLNEFEEISQDVIFL